MALFSPKQRVEDSNLLSLVESNYDNGKLAATTDEVMPTLGEREATKMSRDKTSPKTDTHEGP